VTGLAHRKSPQVKNTPNPSDFFVDTGQDTTRILNRRAENVWPKASILRSPATRLISATRDRRSL
jgi:hypothetical protein